MAGDSRYPGFVCAGDGPGGKVGYPLDWIAATMRCKVKELSKTLKKLSDTDRVTLNGPSDCPVIKINSWNKYQSEYLRQIESLRNRGNKRTNLQTSLQNTKQTRGTSSQKLDVEEEGEGDIEGERDREAEEEEAKRAATPAAITPGDIQKAFEALGHKPFGSASFKENWTTSYLTAQNYTDPPWVDLMEEAIQKCQGAKVRVPGLFYAHKREIEKGSVEMRYRRVVQ
jgi:hypothetical protein